METVTVVGRMMAKTEGAIGRKSGAVTMSAYSGRELAREARALVKGHGKYKGFRVCIYSSGNVILRAGYVDNVTGAEEYRTTAI